MMRCNLWQWGLAGSLTILVTTPTLAQITPDGTLPNNSTVRQDVIKGLPSDVIEGGTQRGGNLFHSFSDFNVDEGRGAYFANPAGVDNILSRVTGGNPSLIFGTLGVLGGANLYFLNPSGIFFGSNSKLDIQGSFIGTTADGIYLGDEGFFNASEPQNSNLLSINPGVLFFNQVAQQPGNIINQGYLAVGRDLTLSASSNLTVGGQLTAGGNLTLQGLNIKTNAQLVSGGNFQVLQLDGNLNGLSSSDGTVIRAGGDVFLSSYIGASLHILAGGKVEIPGFILIQSLAANGLEEKVTLSDGTMVDINGKIEATLDIRAGISNAEGSGTPTSADINVGTIFFRGAVKYILGNILLTNQYQPNANLAGNIRVTATLGPPFEGIAIQNSSFDGGGTIAVDSRGDTSLNGFVNIYALDSSPEKDSPTFIGNGGDVTLLAEKDINFSSDSSIFSEGLLGGQITFKSGGTISLSGGVIVSNSTDKPNDKKGNINITARSLILTDGASISTNSSVASGDLTVKASELLKVSGTTPSGESSSQLSASGNLKIIETGHLLIDDGGLIGTTVFGSEDSGDITIEATEVEVRGSRTIAMRDPIPSRISTQVVGEGIGTSGDIEIETGRLRVGDGGLIETSTFTSGKSGNLTINASEVEIFGTIPISDIQAFSFIGTQSRGEGNSGDIVLETARLIIRNGGEVFSRTFGSGNSGKIDIEEAISVEVFGTSLDGRVPSVLSTQVESGATDKSGDLNIDTERLSIRDGGLVGTFTFGSGISGNVNIKATTEVDVSGTTPNGQFASSLLTVVGVGGTGNSGNLTLNTKRLSVGNGGQILTGTRGSGNSGNIDIKETTEVEVFGTASIPQPPDIIIAPSGILTVVSPDIIDSQGNIIIKTGNSGNITLDTERLSVRDGGKIAASDAGTGTVGNLEVKVSESTRLIGTAPIGKDISDDVLPRPDEREKDDVQLTVQRLQLISLIEGQQINEFLNEKTNLFPSSLYATGAGNITLGTENLSIKNGAQIFTSRSESGGNITITSDGLVEISGRATDNLLRSAILTSVAPDATEVDEGGNLNLTTQRLIINEGAIDTGTIGSAPGGDLIIKASESIELTSSQLSTLTESKLETAGSGGDIEIETGNLILNDSSQISSRTLGRGDAGNILLKVDGTLSTNNSNITASVDKEAQGNGGIIQIQADSLGLNNNSRITASTAGEGNAGNINLPSIQILNLQQSEITVNTSGQGDAGSITIPNAQTISLNNGKITASTSGEGNAGAINLTANENINLSNNSEISSAVNEGANGNAQTITLNTPSLNLRDSKINAFSNGQGNAGSINIAYQNNNANTVNLDNSTISTEIQAGGVATTPSNISIKTGTLNLLNNAQITTRTLGRGDAGSITIPNAQTISLNSGKITASTSGQGDTGVINLNANENINLSNNSEISSAVNEGANGNARSITLNTPTLTLSNNAKITASTDGTGNAGNINLPSTQTLNLLQSEITVSTSGRGNAGSITVPNAQTISLDNGKITASTSGEGNTGVINLNANGNIELSNNSIISNAVRAGARGDARTITLNTPSLNLRDSNITASTDGIGNAGSIEVPNSQSINLDNSTISTAIEKGGVATQPSNINLNTPILNLNNNAKITASTDGTGNAGNINLPSTQTLNLRQSEITVSTSGLGDAGNITIPNAQTISLDRSRITASTSGEGNTGVINLSATQKIELANNSQIRSSVEKDAQGNAQTITLNTPNLSLTARSEISAFSNGQGNAGSINIAYQDNNANAVNLDNSTISTEIQAGGVATTPSNISIKTGTLNLLNNAQITTRTSGRGDAGSITIPNANTISLDNGEITASTSGQGDTGVITLNANENIELSNNSEISSAVETGAIGDARTITLNSPTLTLKDSRIRASTDGTGNAGSIEVSNSQSITLDNSTISTAIEKRGVATQPSNITLNTPILNLSNNAKITASTAGQGDAGNINLPNTQTLNLLQSEITVSTTGKGDAGSITIPNAQTISLDRSRITASTSGQGDTGVINLNANRNIELSNNSEISSAVEAGAIGDARTITLNTPTLTLKDSRITASTDGEGNAGSIEVPNSQNITLDNSTISTDIEKGGIATQPSNINLNTRQLELTDSQIQASSTGQGNAGNINIKVGEQFQITDSQISTSAEQASGGKIEITAPTIRMYGTSSIRTNVEIGAGDGGNITIKADDSIIAFDNSDIVASARDGRGGDITLDTPVFLGEGYQQVRNADRDKLEDNGQVDINASGGIQDGTIRVPNLNNILNSLVKLPTQVVDTEQLLARSCVAPIQNDEGKFIITGANGLPENPGGNSISTYPTEEVRTTSSDGTSSRSWELGDPIIEPQGVYHLSNGKVVLSRECQ